LALTAEQRERYARNLLIPGFGEAGQERLAGASVCVVGLGGLGSPAAFYLAAAGIGTLGLVDSDVVELSNLQRQVLHDTDRVGMAKVTSAVQSLAALNPDVRLRPHDERLTRDNAGALLADYDAVIEACDNFESKFLINDVCLEQRKPFATAGILALSGHALFVVPGQSPCLRCVTPSVPQGEPTTSDFGVLGVVPGMLGSLEAFEVIRWLAGLWQPGADGAGALHSVDGGTVRLKTVKIPRRRGCPCAGLWSDAQ
jgi:molybdopterin-synthase adenylyltransferase